jgi:hypothetical protein
MRAAVDEAIARRHVGHKQSPLAPATGIGSRNASSMHQHAPSRSQPNAVPQRAQFKDRPADERATDEPV